MINNQFTVAYNGQPVAVTILGYNSYMVQITYKPLRIQLNDNFDGKEHWIDLDTGLETPLANELGGSISSYFICTGAGLIGLHSETVIIKAFHQASL